MAVNVGPSGSDFDVVVVGGGHNGLVAAFDMARSGLRPLVLERRSFVGGACVTEEFAPGFMASTGAHVLAMLRESLWRDMKLVERGIVVDPAGPTMNLFSDGRHLQLSHDMEETQREARQFSEKDAQTLVELDAHLARIAKVLVPLYDQTPPDPRVRSLADLVGAARTGRRAWGSRSDLHELSFLLTTSVAQYLSGWLESEHLIAAHSWTSMIDSFSTPRTPGTALLLLHEHAAAGSADEGEARAWGFVRGGMGRVTQAMAEAAVEAGVVIRTDAEVDRILTRAGRAVGVALANGEVIHAPRVVSNADPKRTFLELLDPERDLPQGFVRSVRAYRCSSTSVRLHLALSDLPFVKGLPDDDIQPYHRGFVDLIPTLSEMESHQAQARAGVPAKNSQMEICFPTVHDASLAPAGKHVMDIAVASQPYAGPDWDAIKEQRADEIIDELAQHFPDLPGLIEHRQVLSPLDLERRFGITGGDSRHGEMTPDQMLFMRPVPGYGDYRTPIAGLYLCGAGTHPGGGVSGANGRNAAREILRDAKRRGGRT